MSIILQYINDKNGMENLQSIIIVSIALFSYELILFYFNLIPTIKSKLRNFINNLKYNSDNNMIILFKPILQNNIILDMLRVFYNRENNMINKVNNYTIISGVLLLIILIYILHVLNKKQRINNRVLVISSIILILVFIFQYLFYIFGMNYRYIDSISLEELQYFVLKNL